MNKLPELHHTLYSNVDIDCFLITETWLHDQIPNGFLDPQSNYRIIRSFRCDRSGAGGGGVCIFIRREHRITQLHLCQALAGFEILSFDLLDFYVPYRVFVVYRPPTSRTLRACASAVDVMSQLTSCTTNNISRAGPTIIFGDFIVQVLFGKWNNGQQNHARNCCTIFSVFNGFTQCTPAPTRLNNLLDLVFVNDPLIMSNIKVLWPFSTSDRQIKLTGDLASHKQFRPNSNSWNIYSATLVLVVHVSDVLVRYFNNILEMGKNPKFWFMFGSSYVNV